MLTVQSLLEDLGLSFAAGDSAGRSPVRWVHISELEDPTPFLSGGELMLTTGIPLGDAAAQRRYVRLLARHNLAGLGFGTGFDHAELPPALVDEATKQEFPLFEIPFAVPFIALTEKAFSQLVNEQYEVLQRGIAVQRRLERLVLEERGLNEIAGTISTAIGGAVIILDGRGEQLSSCGFHRELGVEAQESVRAEAIAHGAESHPFAPSHTSLAGRALAQPVVSPGGGPPQAWVVAVRDSGLGDFERMIVQQAAAVVALELMRRRVARETERRLAGDLLAAALGGRLDAGELCRRLEPFGIDGEAAVLVFAVDDPAAAEPVLERALVRAGCPALVAPHTSGGNEVLCAVVAAGEISPVEVADAARAELVAKRGTVRAAASRPRGPEGLRRGFHEARCALEATQFANGSAPAVASWEDLGAFTLLLSVQDDDALLLYCESVLGPIEASDDDYGSELLRSLEAFIEANGQWERAAREVYCHRHTLRYRMRRVEELTGRDLSRAHDRIEFWLALRARELVTEGSHGAVPVN